MVGGRYRAKWVRPPTEPPPFRLDSLRAAHARPKLLNHHCRRALLTTST